MALAKDASGNSPIGFAVETHIDEPTGSGSGGGGGDATAANQVTANSKLDSVISAIGTTNANTDTVETKLQSLIDDTTAAAVYGRSAEYETVAASQTDQVMGTTGAAANTIEGILVIPATTSPGPISIKDGAGSALTVFTGGASSVSNLVPFWIPLNNIQCTTNWKVTTGTNVSCYVFGDFT